LRPVPKRRAVLSCGFTLIIYGFSGKFTPFKGSRLTFVQGSADGAAFGPNGIDTKEWPWRQISKA